jgi:hypothetical protein
MPSHFGAPPIGKGCAGCPAPYSVIFGQIGVRWRPLHSIALTKPLQQVAVFAAFATKRFVFGRLWFAAQRAGGLVMG